MSENRIAVRFTLWFFIIWSALSLADVWSTQVGIAHGYTEQNVYANVSDFWSQFFPRRAAGIVILSSLVFAGTKYVGGRGSAKSIRFQPNPLVTGPCLILCLSVLALINNWSLILMGWSAQEIVGTWISDKIRQPMWVTKLIFDAAIFAILFYPVRKAIIKIWSNI